jgi:2-iminobutanoate/2-iminopropanoate deaminase
LKKIITSPDAPIGPYSQGVVASGFLFVSGQIPLDPRTGETVQGDISVQTERVLDNIGAILKAAKMGAPTVVKATVYMTDLGEFAAMNAVYEKYFGKDSPARSTVQVAALPKGVKVEIDVIAAF